MRNKGRSPTLDRIVSEHAQRICDELTAPRFDTGNHEKMVHDSWIDKGYSLMGVPLTPDMIVKAHRLLREALRPENRQKAEDLAF